MSTPPRSPVLGVVERLFPRLKYPQMFAVLAALFLIDLVFPDPIPFIDEALLAFLTLLVGSLRARRESPPPQPPTSALPDTGSSTSSTEHYDGLSD